MKKRISLISLILLLTFGLAGCGSTKTQESVDKESLENMAKIMIEGVCQTMEPEMVEDFHNMSDFQLNMVLLNSNITMSEENFIEMLDSWQAGVEECGTFIGLGESKLEQTNDGSVVTFEAEFADRDATIDFSFDENGVPEVMTVNAKYTLGEILGKAGMNTLLGMGTVFVVLIFIAFIISLFKYIPNGEKKADEKEAEVMAAAPPVQENLADDSELVAVIAAAIAAAEGTTTDGFVVRSIKRRKSNKWN